MKISNVFFAFFLFYGVAHGAENCSTVIPSGAHLFKQYNLGAEFACLYQYSKFPTDAVLDFYKGETDHGVLIGSNHRLISLEDIEDNSNIPDINMLDSGSYQIVWSYPNGVDELVLSRSTGNILFNSASKELRLPSADVAKAVASIVLVNYVIHPNSLEFSEINSADIFDGAALKLKGIGAVAKINVEKAFLYSDPSESARIKSYLVKGDEVNLLEYKSGFLKISYNMKSGKALIRWIELSSII
ncbi:hypothetical protein F0170_09930 [Pseudomonas sp. MAFF 730085]|uniref:SH3 domain-containing protein n=1 Tax=Pseudomonas kitaguniensis TaxID=2607908 RepID=A0A5N7JSI1_9PSED|nr:hypothetical protein [Pseudomonas kitaguniensis]MPQ84275.1 hypothetical protein [Pseudomonas kitaguniensis]